VAGVETTVDPAIAAAVAVAVAVAAVAVAAAVAAVGAAAVAVEAVAVAVVLAEAGRPNFPCDRIRTPDTLDPRDTLNRHSPGVRP